jgi:hypothetical protein
MKDRVARLEREIQEKRAELGRILRSNDELFLRLRDKTGRARAGSPFFAALAVLLVVSIGVLLGFSGSQWARAHAPIAAVRVHARPSIVVAGCPPLHVPKASHIERIELLRTCPEIGCIDLVVIERGTLQRFIGKETTRRSLTDREIGDLFRTAIAGCFFQPQATTKKPGWTTAITVQMGSAMQTIAYLPGQAPRSTIDLQEQILSLAGGARPLDAKLPLVASVKTSIEKTGPPVHGLIDFDLFLLEEHRYRVLAHDDSGRAFLAADVTTSLPDTPRGLLSVEDTDADGYRDVVVPQGGDRARVFTWASDLDRFRSSD